MQWILSIWLSSPRAPNLLHVLPSWMVGWNEFCNPAYVYESHPHQLKPMKLSLFHFFVCMKLTNMRLIFIHSSPWKGRYDGSVKTRCRRSRRSRSERSAAGSMMMTMKMVMVTMKMVMVIMTMRRRWGRITPVHHPQVDINVAVWIYRCASLFMGHLPTTLGSISTDQGHQRFQFSWISNSIQLKAMTRRLMKVLSLANMAVGGGGAKGQTSSIVYSISGAMISKELEPDAFVPCIHVPVVRIIAFCLNMWYVTGISIIPEISKVRNWLVRIRTFPHTPKPNQNAVS